MSGNRIDVTVDNNLVSALVDSGASFSVVSEKYRRLLRKVMFPSDNKCILKIADGNYVQPTGKCILRLSIDGRSFPFEFIVLSKCSHDIILGWDFLETSQAVIDCGRSELLFEDVPKEPPLQDSWRLFANKDYIIPAQSMAKIGVSFSESKALVDVIVIGNKLLLLKGITIPSTVITVWNGLGEIWVVNGQADPCYIPAGMHIGGAEPLFKESLSSITAISERSLDKNEGTTTIDYSSMIAVDLNSKQKECLQQLLNEFAEVFNQSRKPNSTKVKVKHCINTGDSSPIKQRPYRVSPTERRIIQEEVNKMLERDVIEPSDSPWSSPVVLVRKKDNSWRFCVDYRRLNKITKKDVYPLPRIDDTLDCLKGANFFSSMDLSSGYWQVEVDEADREKTAFITPEGLYQFKVMPFGLCNAPATFERMMDNILRHLKWTTCLCYLDDIIVFSETFSEHLKRLNIILKCMNDAGLILNPKKCCFGTTQLKVLGHVISSGYVQPDPDKVKAVKEFPVPKNVHDIRSFLGLCSYYRRFIKDFCNQAKPLQMLLKGDAKFFWGKEQIKSFDHLKQALTSNPVLGLYDENAPTELHSDASGYGIGAVLVQFQEGKEKVIGYASRTLNKAEQNYSTTERECLAAIWAINKFRPYLFGKHFTIVTDHHSLCWLSGLKDPSGRLARWALRLQEYDVTIVYKSGHKHKDADSLSRNPLPNDTLSFEASIAVVSFSDLQEEQSRDPEITKLVQAQRNGQGTAKNFKIINGVLYKKDFDPTGKNWLPVIPKCWRKDIIQSFHDEPTAGHLGFSRTYDRIRKRFYWSGLYRSVQRYVRHCRECQRRKSLPLQPPGQLMPIPPAVAPFHRIGVDLLGRFPKTNRNNKWIVVCTDYLSRYAITKALPTAEASEVSKFLVEEIVLKHGAPRIIITDRGQVFQSKLVSDINRLCNITHRMTTAYHPQTNGLTERFNKTLADMLSMYVDVDQKNWDDILPFVTFAYNTAKQETTGFTPFFLIHGREAETTLDTMFPIHLEDTGYTDNYISQLINKAEESRNLARIRTLKAQEKDRLRYDSKHRIVFYEPGDLVWIFTPIRKVGLSEKLLKRYFGPYQVLRRLSDVTYEVADFDPTSRRRKKKDIVHVLRMKPYHNPEIQEELENEDFTQGDSTIHIEIPKEVITKKKAKSNNKSYTGPITRSRSRAT